MDMATEAQNGAKSTEKNREIVVMILIVMFLYYTVYIKNTKRPSRIPASSGVQICPPTNEIRCRCGRGSQVPTSSALQA